MRVRGAIAALAVLQLLCAAPVAVAGATGAALRFPHAAGSAGIWGDAEEVPGTATLNAGGSAAVLGLSCPSAGNCSAAGDYIGAGAAGQQAFVVDETNGTWGNAEEVPGLATLNTGTHALVESLACASVGNCAMAGQYQVYSATTYQAQAFVVDETNGTWGTAEEIPGTATLNAGGGSQGATVFALSCPSAGNCSGGGVYTDASGVFQAFVVDETNGVWGDAEQVQGTGTATSPPAGWVTSISCPSAGNCVAGGLSDIGPFIVFESNGTWGSAEAVPGLVSNGGSDRVTSISCPSAGNCAVGGLYTDDSGKQQAFVVDETSGSWGDAEDVPGTATLNVGGLAAVSSIACSSAGNCLLDGWYEDSAGNVQAFLVNETGGTWGSAEELPGIASLNAGGEAEPDAVSCPSAGNCAVGGLYKDGSNHEQAFLLNETSGTWGSAEETPGTATLNIGGYGGMESVSCASAGNCAGGGWYTDAAGHTQAFVVDESTTAPLSTSVALSSSRSPVPLGSKVVYTAKVNPAPNGGSVSFEDDKAPISSCQSVPLSSGAATCEVSYAAIGTHSITASYSGDAGYLGSSTATALTELVTKATATASLFALPGATLTASPVRLTVTVSPPGSGLPAPTGTASFYEASKLLAQVPLSTGKASYTLSFATAGNEALTATYSGDGNYLTAKSAVVTEIVAAPGYRLVGGDGGVFDFGSTPYKGGLHGKVLPAPIVGIANTNDAEGYWMVGSTGQVYPFGDAVSYGELTSNPSSAVIGIAATVDSKGYWLAEANGTVAAFGDAEKFPPVSKLSSAVAAIVADPQGGGYWLVTKGAGVYGFGNAHTYPEAKGQKPVSGSVTAMSALPDAEGYWLMTSTEGVYAFGAAKIYSLTGGNKPPAGSAFVGMATYPNGTGYWLVTSTGYVEALGTARYLGDEHTAKLTKPICGVSAFP